MIKGLGMANPPPPRKLRLCILCPQLGVFNKLRGLTTRSQKNTVKSRCMGVVQRRNDGVAAASSDGGPTGGRGPPTVLFYFKSEGRGPDLRK